MPGKQMMRMEEVQLGGDETRGAVLMTVGKLLLWTDLILFPRPADSAFSESHFKRLDG